MTPQETDPDLPVKCPGASGRDMGLWWALRVEGTECSSVYMVPFEGGPYYSYYPTIVWPQDKIQGGNTGHPSAENSLQFSCSDVSDSL